jgi:hypothetical protein
VIDWRFVGLLIGLLAASAVIGWIFVGEVDGGRPAFIAGLVFSMVSVAVGFHWIRWSASRRGTHFLAAALGGFLARVVGLLIFALALAAGTDLNLSVALLTVVVAHLVFGMAEVAYVNRTGGLG